MSRLVPVSVLPLSSLIATTLLVVVQPHTAKSEELVEDRREVSIPTEWKEIQSLNEKIELLELIVSEMSANYDRIRTWQGAYAELSEQQLSPKELPSVDANLPSGSSIQKRRRAICSFEIDCSANVAHLRIKDSTVEYYSGESDVPLDVKSNKAKEDRCILTPEKYVRFTPEYEFGNFGSLRAHDLPSKRASFRRPPGDADLSYYSEFVDPRVFFRISGDVKLWDEYEISYLPIFRGEYGEERQKLFDGRLSIARATRDGTTWIRSVFHQLLEGAPPLKEYIYSSDAGFNVVRFTEWKGGDPFLLYSWTFQRIEPDGIYVPSVVDVQYSGLTKHRVFTLQKCILNEPIDPARFTEAALELEDGDLLMDDVESIAYEWKDGKAEKLADYGEPPPVDPSETDSPSRVIYVLLGLALLIGIVVSMKVLAKR